MDPSINKHQCRTHSNTCRQMQTSFPCLYIGKCGGESKWHIGISLSLIFLSYKMRCRNKNSWLKDAVRIESTCMSSLYKWKRDMNEFLLLFPDQANSGASFTFWFVGIITGKRKCQHRDPSLTPTVSQSPCVLKAEGHQIKDSNGCIIKTHCYFISFLCWPKKLEPSLAFGFQGEKTVSHFNLGSQSSGNTHTHTHTHRGSVLGPCFAVDCPGKVFFVYRPWFHIVLLPFSK